MEVESVAGQGTSAIIEVPESALAVTP
jgi:hypothetical protein